MEQLKQFLKDKNVKSILDIGTGSGQFASQLLQIFPKAELTGIDPSTEGFEKATEKLAGYKTQFFKMNAEQLDFESDSFDLVSLSNALHHLPYLEKSLAEIKRVVATGGYIVINELLADNLSPAQENQKYYHHLKSYTDRLTGNFHHETWTKQGILNIIEENGIKILTHFDHFDGRNFITETENIDFWVNRLQTHIDGLKGHSVYDELLPKVEEFRKRLEKVGMMHATNVVVMGVVS